MVRTHRLLAASALLSTLVLIAGACGKKKLEPNECNQVRGKAFAVLNEAANCKSDKDCLASSWPGCAHEANQDMLDRLKPIKDEFEAGGCAETKQDCPKTPDVFCNQYVCEKRTQAIRTEQP